MAPAPVVTSQAVDVDGALPDSWFGQAREDHVTNPLATLGSTAVRAKRWTPKTIVRSVVLVLLAGMAIRVVWDVFLAAPSPQPTASAVVSDLQTGSFSQVCTLALPTQVSKCDGDLWPLAAHNVRYQSLTLGTVTARGNRALFVMTGSVCVGPTQCFVNHDPNAALGSGMTFDQQYALAVSSSLSNPMFVPLVEQDGKWYVTGF
jgi:hypothetical protein